MCPDCALENEDEHKEVLAFAHYEGQLSCEECGELIDGAYYEEESESESD